MSLCGNTKAVHRRRRTDSMRLLGFVSKCLACWNPSRQMIQCYVTTYLQQRTVWVARVALGDYDSILGWPTHLKEQRFTKALEALLPIGSQIVYTEKKDRRTQESIYFAADVSFDGCDLSSLAQKS